jgi:anti-anti-sigma regulatory factor
MPLSGLAPRTRRLPRLVLSLSTDDDTTVIGLHGDADLGSLPRLVDTISGVIANQHGAVVLDLADSDFIDPACVRAVGLIAQWLTGNERSLTVRSPPRLSIMLFASFGLSDLCRGETTDETPGPRSGSARRPDVGPVRRDAVGDRPSFTANTAMRDRRRRMR